MRAHAHGQLAPRVPHKAPRPHTRGPRVVHADGVTCRWWVNLPSRAGYQPPHRAVGSRHNDFLLRGVRHSDVGPAEHAPRDAHKVLIQQKDKLRPLAVRLVARALHPQRALIRHHQALVRRHRHHHGLLPLKVVWAQAPKYRLAPVHRPRAAHALAVPKDAAPRLRHRAALAAVCGHKLHPLVIKHRRVHLAHREKVGVWVVVREFAKIIRPPHVDATGVTQRQVASGGAVGDEHDAGVVEALWRHALVLAPLRGHRAAAVGD